MSVVDAETLTLPLRLRVREGVDALDSLREVTAYMAHNLEKLVLVKPLRGQPKRDVFVARGVFTVRFELSDLALLELVDEAAVFTPEQSDVLNVEKLHRPAFQSEAECPTHLSLYIFSSIDHDSVVDDSRAKYFQPVIVIKDFKFYRRFREWEVGLDPAHFDIAEN